MRIAIDARTLGWSGIGRYTQKLLENLQLQDRDNEYMVLLSKSEYETWQPTSDNFKKILANFPPFSISEQLGLLRLLNKLKPDLVHFTNFNAPAFYSGRQVVTVHDLQLLEWSNLQGSRFKQLRSRLKRPVARWVLKRVCKRSQNIITPTLFVKKKLDWCFW